MKFVDETTITVSAGHGGDGSLSFRREKFIEFGGPNGGNGGKGGDVIAVAVDNLNTLIDYRYRQHIKAKNGRPGMGKDMTGANGANATLRLPTGTQILNYTKTRLIADLTEPGQSVLLLNGGKGGKGNTAFKSATNQAPRRSESGEPGKELTIWLRLKLIADIALVGLPNAGKSTFLSANTGARPKIADYPFTTLHPNLGVLYQNDAEIILADIPGLISGANSGAGLGDRFLGHIERCAGLLHLVDGTEEDVILAYKTIRAELSTYDTKVAKKPEIICLNKCDALTKTEISQKKRMLEEASKQKVFCISGISGSGTKTVIDNLTKLRQSALQGATAYENKGSRPLRVDTWQP